MYDINGVFSLRYLYTPFWHYLVPGTSTPRGSALPPPEWVVCVPRLSCLSWTRDGNKRIHYVLSNVHIIVYLAHL